MTDDVRALLASAPTAALTIEPGWKPVMADDLEAAAIAAAKRHVEAHGGYEGMTIRPSGPAATWPCPPTRFNRRRPQAPTRSPRPTLIAWDENHRAFIRRLHQPVCTSGPAAVDDEMEGLPSAEDGS